MRATPEHVWQVQKLWVPDGMVSVGLDRNPRGMAIMSEETFFLLMEELYGNDPKFYKLLRSEKEEEEWLRRIDAADLRLRPWWVPRGRKGPMTREQLGFEYPNLKE